MTFRGPLVSPPRVRPGPASFEPRNLQESTLASAGAKPFLLSDWPLPRAAAYPNDNRTFTRAAQTQLIGKDVFFGAAGMAPAFDWPLPRSAVYPNDNRTFTRAAQTQLIGKDTFFGAPGMAPDFDWPLARSAFQPSRGWTWSWGPLVPAPAPFYQNDWPLPKSSPAPVNLRTSLNALALNLLGQDAFFGAPGQPPANLDWPLPKSAPYPLDNRTHARAAQTQLIGQDLFFGAPGMALVLDWPLARIAPAQNRSFTWSPPVPAPVAAPFSQTDWPNPRGAASSPSVRGFVAWQQLVPVLPAPFSQSDWPTPRAAAYPASLRTFVAWQQLLPVIVPFNQSDWPLPRAAAYPASLRSHASWPQLTPPPALTGDTRYIVTLGARDFTDSEDSRDFTVTLPARDPSIPNF